MQSVRHEGGSVPSLEGVYLAEHDIWIREGRGGSEAAEWADGEIHEGIWIAVGDKTARTEWGVVVLTSVVCDFELCKFIFV